MNAPLPKGRRGLEYLTAAARSRSSSSRQLPPNIRHASLRERGNGTGGDGDAAAVILTFNQTTKSVPLVSAREIYSFRAELRAREAADAPPCVPAPSKHESQQPASQESTSLLLRVYGLDASDMQALGTAPAAHSRADSAALALSPQLAEFSHSAAPSCHAHHGESWIARPLAAACNDCSSDDGSSDDGGGDDDCSVSDGCCSRFDSGRDSPHLRRCGTAPPISSLAFAAALLRKSPFSTVPVLPSSLSCAYREPGASLIVLRHRASVSGTGSVSGTSSCITALSNSLGGWTRAVAALEGPLRALEALSDIEAIPAQHRVLGFSGARGGAEACWLPSGTCEKAADDGCSHDARPPAVGCGSAPLDSHSPYPGSQRLKLEMPELYALAAATERAFAAAHAPAAADESALLACRALLSDKSLSLAQALAATVAVFHS